MEPLASGDPARIGPFRLVARLGRGGMGRVYLGRSETTGRAVAVKTVHGELLADPEFRIRFSHEVAAAQKVRDEYIAEVVAADPDGATPWLATAYAPGISVEDAVRRFGPLPADSVRILGVCVAKAVASIHAVGLVHRDLKPANVLLTAAGPKVIDFGIARGESEAALTRTGMVSGSPPYMAPEQLGYGTFSTASDIFSLGAVLHYAATATGPYGRGGAQEQYARAMGVGPVVDPALPDSLHVLVSRCFAGDPTVRPTTQAVIHALEACPGERPLPGWLPSAVVADILAQATDALNKDSAAGLVAPQAPVRPRTGSPAPNASDGASYAPQQRPQAASAQQPSPSFAPLVPPPPSGPRHSSAPPDRTMPPDRNTPPQRNAPPQHANAPLGTPQAQPSAPYRGQDSNGSPSGRPFTGPPPQSAPRSTPHQPSHPHGPVPPHFAARSGPQPYAPSQYPPPQNYPGPPGYPASQQYPAAPSYPGQPAPPAHYGYQYQAPAPAPSNGIAVAALVLSLVGFAAPCVLLVALPLGGVGLSKARKIGVGRGQALAGTIVSGTLLLGWTVLLSVLLARSS